MSTGETVDFNEFHRGSLEKVMILGERIALLTPPHWCYGVKPGTSELELVDSDFKVLMAGSDLSEAERDAVADLDRSYSSAAFTFLTALAVYGIVDQVRGMTEENIPRMMTEQQKHPLEVILKDSQTAWASSFAFVDNESGQSFEVLRSSIKSNGLEGGPIDVEGIRVKIEDDLVIEWMSVTRSGDSLRVHYEISPVEDELLDALVQATLLSSDDNPKLHELYEAGFLTMIGRAGAVEKLAEIQAELDSPRFNGLCARLLERFNAVVATKDWNSQTSLPSAEKLEDTIELLEAIAEGLEG